jgi:hypothetical protein
MKRRSSDTARRAGLIAVAVALAAAIAAARSRQRARDTGGGLERSEDQTYTCDCGTPYRVSGTDRHTVYWPAGAPDGEPVLGDRCVTCDAPLPGRTMARD